MDSRSPLLILGLGNLLCSDDGVGVVAAQAIAETRVVPDGVQVLDGGTLGLALLPYLEDAERAILVDAIEIDAPPGTLVRLEGDDVGPGVRRAPQRAPGGRLGPDRGGALARPDPADARPARRRARDHGTRRGPVAPRAGRAPAPC